MSGYRIIWQREHDTHRDFDELLVLKWDSETGRGHLNTIHRYGYVRGWHEYEGVELTREAIPALIEALSARLSAKPTDNSPAAIEGEIEVRPLPETSGTEALLPPGVLWRHALGRDVLSAARWLDLERLPGRRLRARTSHDDSDEAGAQTCRGGELVLKIDDWRALTHYLSGLLSPGVPSERGHINEDEP